MKCCYIFSLTHLPILWGMLPNSSFIYLHDVSTWGFSKREAHKSLFEYKWFLEIVLYFAWYRTGTIYRSFRSTTFSMQFVNQKLYFPGWLLIVKMYVSLLKSPNTSALSVLLPGPCQGQGNPNPRASPLLPISWLVGGGITHSKRTPQPASLTTLQRHYWQTPEVTSLHCQWCRDALVSGQNSMVKMTSII